MSRKPTKPPSSLRRGLWSVILGLFLACGPPVAYGENFQTQGQNTYCVTCSVGIGTSSPVSKLHVFTTNQAQATVESSSGTATDTALELRANSRRWSLGINLGGLGSGKFFIYDTTAGASRLMIDTSGNIGIGTTAPAKKLDVRNGQKTVDNGTLLRLGSTDASPVIMDFAIIGSATPTNQGISIDVNEPGVSDDRPLVLQRWGGNVGIGVPAPAARLHTYDANGLGPVVNNNKLLERISGATGNTMMRNLWLVRTAAGSDWTTAKLHDAISVDVSFLAPGTDTRTWWERNPSAQTQSWGASGSTFMTLSAAGDLGIGTSAPTAKVHVVGNAYVTGSLTVDGNIAAKYQDIAEWVPSRGQLKSGTVVILDETRTNGVLASDRSYDTRVAGVVSARPGLVLGEGGENKVLVATTGRVKVRVEATSTPIHVGDLLVTSDLPGVAMRSEPIMVGGVRLHRAGTLIGKALEQLAKGQQGEILVLLSLQ